MDWNQLPKVELHLHLDCSLSYDVVSRIDPSVTRDEYDVDFVAPAKCANIAEFFAPIPRSLALMQTEEYLRLVTLDLFEQLAADNVIYAEIRFAPLLHLEQGLSAREVVAAVEEAAAEGIERTGVEARIILCTLRPYTTAQSMETVRLVDQFHGTYVAGFDIAADKPGDVISDHIPAFRYAQEKGIPRTAHAGEVTGPDVVWATLREFKPSRLGHGVRSIEDPVLFEHLRESQVHLEVCPSSNVQTDVFDAYAVHSIDRLYRAGLSVGVNTDTRGIGNITLGEEYEKLHRTFGWGVREFSHCNSNALKAAFVPDDVRDVLMVRLDDGYQQHLPTQNR